MVSPTCNMANLLAYLTIARIGKIVEYGHRQHVHCRNCPNHRHFVDAADSGSHKRDFVF